jgi:hypothetical protein
MTTEPLPDRWTGRDYPVLLAIVRSFDDGKGGEVSNDFLPAASGLDHDQVVAAVGNLQRGGFVDASWGPGGRFVVNDITERALRTAGAWPQVQQAADQLLWFLERKVEEAVTDDEQGRWQRIRDSFGSAGRDFAVEVAAAMATRSMGA